MWDVEHFCPKFLFISSINQYGEMILKGLTVVQVHGGKDDALKIYDYSGDFFWIDLRQGEKVRQHDEYRFIYDGEKFNQYGEQNNIM